MTVPPIQSAQIYTISHFWHVLFGSHTKGRRAGREDMRHYVTLTFGRELTEKASRNELNAREAAMYIGSLERRYEDNLQQAREQRRSPLDAMSPQGV